MGRSTAISLNNVLTQWLARAMADRKSFMEELEKSVQLLVSSAANQAKAPVLQKLVRLLDLGKRRHHFQVLQAENPQLVNRLLRAVLDASVGLMSRGGGNYGITCARKLDRTLCAAVFYTYREDKKVVFGRTVRIML